MCVSLAVDTYEFTALNEQISVGAVMGTAETPENKTALDAPFEFKPHFHEWATALPGMICVSRKARNSTFRNYVAAETATPVITCCACLGEEDSKNFYFSGVTRSKSVRTADDGQGPAVDEFFTVSKSKAHRIATPVCPSPHTTLSSPPPTLPWSFGSLTPNLNYRHRWHVDHAE